MLVATYNVNVNVNKKFSDCQLIACQSVTFQSLSLLDGKQMHRKRPTSIIITILQPGVVNEFTVSKYPTKT